MELLFTSAFFVESSVHNEASVCLGLLVVIDTYEKEVIDILATFVGYCLRRMDMKNGKNIAEWESYHVFQKVFLKIWW